MRVLREHGVESTQHPAAYENRGGTSPRGACRQLGAQPLIIAMLAVPILVQVHLNSALAYWLNRKLGVAYNVACPSALVGASNFFELAVAAAISLFDFESGAHDPHCRGW